MKEALVLVDIQNDYFEGGNCTLFQAEQASKKALSALEYFRNNHKPVIFIKHISEKPNATFFIPNTSGCELHKSIEPMSNETVIIKHVPNSFHDTDLHGILQKDGIEHLVVCGMMSHMCIDTTVRAAKDLDYSVTVLEDACTTKDLQWNGVVISASIVHRTFMASLNGAFGKVVTVEEFLKGR